MVLAGAILIPVAFKFVTADSVFNGDNDDEFVKTVGTCIESNKVDI